MYRLESNQVAIASPVSIAIRNVCFDFSAVADREMAKSSSLAASITFLRVASVTISGLANVRDTVATDTPSLTATS